MKRHIIATALMLCTIGLAAQTTQEQFKQRYERQSRIAGPAGVGVETIITRWKEAFPEDPEACKAEFNYFYAKSLRTEVVRKDCEKYLGVKPVLSIPDTSGVKVNFFEESFFTDSLFALSSTAISKAISLKPEELSYRLLKTAALLAYEKESPDLTCAEIRALVDMDKSQKPAWTFDGEPVDEDTFISCIQEYCRAFYNIGTSNSMECFREISEKMAALHPSNSTFVSNLGSYWLVGKKNGKKAIKYYNKAIKLNPEDYGAIKNCMLAARLAGNTKLAKKMKERLESLNEQ